MRTRHHFPGKGREEETVLGGTTGRGNRPGSLISLTPPWLALLPAPDSCKTFFPELPPREVPQAHTGLHQGLVQGAVRRGREDGCVPRGKQESQSQCHFGSDVCFFDPALQHRRLSTRCSEVPAKSDLHSLSSRLSCCHFYLEIYRRPNCYSSCG